MTAERARASARRNPLCVDPWAARLAGTEGEKLADRAGSTVELYVALRTAWLDERVRALCAPAPGACEQVVVLGAGLDTRAARLGADLGRERVRWFEVDHPGSQAVKRQRLADVCESYPLDAARYVLAVLYLGACAI